MSDQTDKDDKDESEQDAPGQEESTESEEVISDESDESEEPTSDESDESSDESEESSDESSDESDEESSDESSEDSEHEAAAKPPDDAHDDDGQHGDNHGHGISHVASPMVLLGTFGSLMVLTILTVGATFVDLGSSMNLLVAIVVATIKAGLVCMFFMHLRYDKVLHTVAFLSALLFALLFVSFTLMDSSEYQEDIVWVEEAQ